MEKMNKITREQNYNICPRCGHPAYAFLMDNNKYCVGCIHCGLQNGLKTLVEGEVTEQYATQMRKAWNMKCLDSEYNVEAMEVLGVYNGNYVLVDNTGYRIIHVAKNVSEVIQFRVQCFPLWHGCQDLGEHHRPRKRRNDFERIRAQLRADEARCCQED